MKDFLTKLQNQPYETRIKILWGTVLAAGFILVIIWVLSLKSTISGIDGASLIQLNPTTTSNTKQTEIAYASVERVESTAQFLKIYFNLNNPTDDILNTAKLQNITLTFTGNSIQPQSMTDRQGNPFVQKVLSHTQNFGILVFSASPVHQASLTFDQMFLEKNSTDVFQQKLELNLDELIKNSNVRN
jgi:hypothetical protein